MIRFLLIKVNPVYTCHLCNLYWINIRKLVMVRLSARKPGLSPKGALVANRSKAFLKYSP